MKPWIEHITLEGDLLTLSPLSLEHEAGLIKAATDGELWNLYYTSVPTPEHTKAYIKEALDHFTQQAQVPFVVIDKKSRQIAGTTRFTNIDSVNKRLEIGYTWYAQSAQRTGINRECKYLLLRHAFETLNCIAVEFRTHAHNKNSRTAIAKLGATQDGILRQHQIDRSGGYRDSVVFSILNTEWAAVKKKLEEEKDHYSSTAL